MIITTLKGGLGNQMFQYAFGRALAIKNNDTMKLSTEALLNAKKTGTIERDFDIAQFNITAETATATETALLQPKRSLLHKVITKVTNRLLGDNTVCFHEKYANQTGDVFLDGYWQSPRYFQDIRTELLAELTLKKPLLGQGAILLKQMQDTNSVAIHVRRGDYVQNPAVLKEFGICSVSYYNQAIASCKETIDAPHFYIFSDDIEWVKNNLHIDGPTTFVSGNDFTAPQELFLMSACKHNIIANSSFSWWAAWLNQNENKTVIAPTPWFNTVQYDAHLIPTSWTQLPRD